MKAQGSEVALRTIFVFQTELDNIKLQLSDSPDDFADAMLYKKLGNALFGKLSNALIELLCLHWVAVFKRFEDFRRKTRDSAEMKQLALSKRVAYFQRSVIIETDNISRPCFINDTLFIGHEVRRARKADFLLQSGVEIKFVTLEPAGADSEKCCAIPVVGIKIGMNFKDKSAQRFFRSLNHAFGSLPFNRAWRDSEKCFEELFDTEIVDGTAEKNRGQLSVAINIFIKRIINTLNQRNCFTEFFAETFRDPFFKFRVVRIFDLDQALADTGGICFKQV